MHKQLVLFLISILMVLSGCGKSSSDARDMDEFSALAQSTPELQALDVSLDELESKTAELEAQYNEVQGTVLTHVSFDADDSGKVGQLVVFINENNVLIVNDTPMSRNDFKAFADKRLPALCQPVPSLSIHKKSDYDTAAWVLDTIYSHGCTNVDIN